MHELSYNGVLQRCSLAQGRHQTILVLDHEQSIT